MDVSVPLNAQPPSHLLAAVDLGTNSFRMMIGEVQGSCVCPVQVFKETLQLGVCFDNQKCLTEAAQVKIFDCLKRFAEALRAVPTDAVRVVATHAFRQARNIHLILPKAEAILGLPINIISGEEEARLIFQGVMHSLPISEERRLIIDIGGGSTECIIGDQSGLQQLCSLEMGCLSWITKFFPDGIFSEEHFRHAELAAQSLLEPVKHGLLTVGWDAVYASSGTAHILMGVIEANGWARGVLSLPLLERLKQILLVAGSIEQLKIPGLLKDRVSILAGGLAVMIGIFKALHIQSIAPADGALQLGVLYDLVQIPRTYDLRGESVLRVARRFGVDQTYVNLIAVEVIILFGQLIQSPCLEAERMLVWAAWLHDIAQALQRNQSERHAAYIAQYAELPGFSWRNQYMLSSLVLLQRGDLAPFKVRLQEPVFCAQVMALRLAVIKYLNRSDEVRPAWKLYSSNQRIFLVWPDDCRQHYPMTTWLLEEESRQWHSAGVKFSLIDSEEHAQ
ncbi:MAG: Ppx/GppA phosphatase family protein [Pseudomonadota bacterium]